MRHTFGHCEAGRSGRFDFHHGRFGRHCDEMRGESRRGLRRFDFDEEDGGGRRGIACNWERGEGRGHGRFGRHEEHGRGGRRRVFDAGELRLVLLKLIGDQPRHGYDLIRAIEDLTGGNYVPSAGVVYPALSMLQDLGHIEEAASEGGRKAFAITKEGTVDLAANEEKVKELFARLAELAALHARTDSAPIRRAMENLRAVLRNHLGREEVDKNALHDVAAILDEAAQRIERL